MRVLKVLLVLLVVLAAPCGWAQTCTSAQFASGGVCYSLQTLKTAILADPVLAAKPNDHDGNAVIADAFNAPASPACVAYQSAMTPQAQRSAILGPGASQLDNLTAVRQQSLFYAAQGTLDARDVNVRAAFESFTGSQASLKASIEAIFVRSNTTRAMVLYKSSGLCTACTNFAANGTCSAGSPAVTTFEGQITGDIVESARLLP
jgi:hypothetical protein